MTELELFDLYLRDNWDEMFPFALFKVHMNRLNIFTVEEYREYFHEEKEIR